MAKRGKGDNSLAVQEMRDVISAIEEKMEERADINADIRNILNQAEGKGMDKKTLREMVRLRAKDSEKRKEEEELRRLYLEALGLY